MFIRVFAASVVMVLCVPPVHAETLTPEQSRQLDTYIKQRTKPAIAPAQAAPVTADTTAAGGVATVAVPQVPAADSLAVLDTTRAVTPVLTFGMAAGQGVQPRLPQLELWEKQAAQAVVAAFNNPAGNTTADQQASLAAVPAGDPAFEERVSLVRTLYNVDGTDALIRRFVAQEHMKLIIEEVARHIDFSKLSEADRYRLAAIAAVVQTELEDRVLDLGARTQAAALTRAELMQLIVAFDIDAQRSLTQMRLNDDGKIDRAAELDLRLAQYQIVKQFEAGL